MINYRLNGEWDVIHTSVQRSLMVERDEKYSAIVFRITLRRRPLYFVITVIVPVILASPLSAVVYLLPVESGEKSTFSLTVLVFIAVLLVTMSGYMPTTSDSVSVLGKNSHVPL